MSEIEFENDLQYQRFATAPKEESTLPSLLLKTGVAKSQEQANKVLVGAVIFFILLAGYLLYRNYSQNEKFEETKSRYKEGYSSVNKKTRDAIRQFQNAQ